MLLILTQRSLRIISFLANFQSSNNDLKIYPTLRLQGQMIEAGEQLGSPGSPTA
jgi:hypothetical protein